MIQEIRCAAPHPSFGGARCRRKLAVVDGPPLVVLIGESRPGSIVISCPRCGTENVIAPRTTLFVFSVDGIVSE